MSAASPSSRRRCTTRRTSTRKDLRIGEQVIVLRAGDVIPQVVAPAPHVAERERPPAEAAAAGALPGLRHADGQARGLGVHALPEPRLPGPALPAADALRLARWTSTGSARSRCSLFMELGWLRTAADIYRLREREQRAARARRIRRDLRTQAVRRDRGVQARSRSAACCSRSGSRRSATSPAAALAQQFRTVDALLAADPEALEQTPGVGPKMARRSTSSWPTRRCAR